MCIATAYIYSPCRLLNFGNRVAKGCKKMSVEDRELVFEAICLLTKNRLRISPNLRRGIHSPYYRLLGYGTRNIMHGANNDCVSIFEAVANSSANRTVRNQRPQ